MLEAALHFMDAEADSEHPDPIGDALDLFRDARDLCQEHGLDLAGCPEKYTRCLEALQAFQAAYDEWMEADSPGDVEFPNYTKLLTELKGDESCSAG